MGVATRAAIGGRGSVKIAEESVLGVRQRPTHRIDFTGESLSANENTLQSEAIRGDRGAADLIRGTVDISGDLNFEQKASGLGMVVRHALGDYVKCPKTDGGVHGRITKDAIQVSQGQDGDFKAVIALDEAHSGGFNGAGGLFAVVHRTGATGFLEGDLTFDAGTGDAGYAYDSACGNEIAIADSAGASVTDGTYTGWTTTDVISVLVKAVWDAEGNAVAPDFSADGGIVKIGSDRTEYRYFEAVAENDSDGNPGMRLYLDPATADPATAVVGDFQDVVVVGVASLAQNTAAATTWTDAPPVGIGHWAYDYDPSGSYDGVITHHMERGRRLPVGLTIEVDRDAAVFLYSGCRTSTLTLNYEQNSIVTGTASYVGKAEYAMAVLAEDVLPGATSVTVRNANAFPDPAGLSQGTAQLTLREETGIVYTTKTDNGDGTVTLSGIDADTTKTIAIQRFHPKGGNVDSRTSIAVDALIESSDKPLTSFETMAYMGGYFEEVMGGNVTLENNINTDKYMLGSRERAAMPEEDAAVTAQVTMEFDDGKHYVKFMEGEFFSLEFKCITEGWDAYIGSTNIRPQMYAFLPRCKFDGNTPNIEGKGYIQHDMPITAVPDRKLKTTDLVVIIVNGEDEDVELTV